MVKESGSRDFWHFSLIDAGFTFSTINLFEVRSFITWFFYLSLIDTGFTFSTIKSFKRSIYHVIFSFLVDRYRFHVLNDKSFSNPIVTHAEQKSLQCRTLAQLTRHPRALTLRSSLVQAKVMLLWSLHHVVLLIVWYSMILKVKSTGKHDRFNFHQHGPIIDFTTRCNYKTFSIIKHFWAALRGPRPWTWRKKLGPNVLTGIVGFRERVVFRKRVVETYLTWAIIDSGGSPAESVGNVDR